MGKIQNEHQANVTRKRIKEFEESIAEHEKLGLYTTSKLQKAQIDSRKSLLEDLKAELAEWESASGLE